MDFLHFGDYDLTLSVCINERQAVKLALTTLGLFFALFGTAFRLDASDVNLVADPWCPYNCKQTDRDQGILINLARDAFEKHGISTQYKTYPWSRAIKMVETGQANGLVGAGREEVPNLLFTTAPIAQARHSFFVRQGDTWAFNGFASLHDRKLGAIQDYSYGDFRETYLLPNKDKIDFAVGTRALGQLIKMLEAGRIDTIIAEERVFRDYMLRSGSTLPTVNAGNAAVEDIYIGFSPVLENSSELVRILEKEISQESSALYTERYFGAVR